MTEEEHDDNELLKECGMAADMNVPPSRLAKARLTGDPDAAPPFIKLGRLVRYRRGDYRVWLAERRRYQSTSETK